MIRLPGGEGFSTMTVESILLVTLSNHINWMVDFALLLQAFSRGTSTFYDEWKKGETGAHCRRVTKQNFRYLFFARFYITICCDKLMKNEGT